MELTRVLTTVGTKKELDFNIHLNRFFDVYKPDRCLGENPRNVALQTLRSFSLVTIGHFDEVFSYFDRVSPGIIVEEMIQEAKRRDPTRPATFIGVMGGPSDWLTLT